MRQLMVRFGAGADLVAMGPMRAQLDGEELDPSDSAKIQVLGMNLRDR